MLDNGRLFLNNEAYESTNEADRLRVILTGMGAVIVVIVCLFFAVIELFIGELGFIPFYGIMTYFHY